MAQASFRAFHFVTDSVRMVREFSRHGFTMRATTREFAAVRNQARHNEGSLRKTPGARVYRVENDTLSGQMLAGTGELVFEGEVLAR